MSTRTKVTKFTTVKELRARLEEMADDAVIYLACFNYYGDPTLHVESAGEIDIIYEPEISSLFLISPFSVDHEALHRNRRLPSAPSIKMGKYRRLSERRQVKLGHF